MSHGRDVRMRGFQSRVSVQEALAWIDTQTVALDEFEAIELSACTGRILANDILAPISVPEFDRSAMDGYALIGAETTHARGDNPLPFRLVGDAFPGSQSTARVTPGAAIRIMTGAPLPAGADAVLPVELTRQAQITAGTESFIEALAPVPPGKNVSRRGEDITSGGPLLPRNRRLRPQDAAILASVGITQISAVRCPTVQILTTGNELVPPGAVRKPFQIFDSNSTLLRCLASRDGGNIVESCWVRDDRTTLRHKLSDSQADVILISGGSSVGAEDFVPGLVEELGTLAIHGVAMRPASPAGIGRIGRSLVFLMPGHPVSCLCAYDFFARRAIRRLGGQSLSWPYSVQTATVLRNINSALGRLDYVRVQLHEGHVESVAGSGASVLSSTVRADGFVLIPEDLDGYVAGSEVSVHLYDSN